MAGPIQTIPQGLLGLLQLKELGVNPSELTTQVSPTLDLTIFYLQRLCLPELALFGGQPTATGQNTSAQGVFQVAGLNCVVPNNESWYVDWMTVATSLVAADTTRFAGGYYHNNATQLAMVQVTNDVADVVTARARIVSCTSIRPFWMPPSSVFAWKIYDGTSVPGYTLNLFLHAARVPI